MYKKIGLFIAFFFLVPSAFLFAQNEIVIDTELNSLDALFLQKAAEAAAKDGLKIRIEDSVSYANQDLLSGYNAAYFKNYRVLYIGKVEMVPLGTTYIAPLGFYSKKLKSIEDLKKGDTVVIPSDPVSGGRALLLLEKAGKLELRPQAEFTPAPADIVKNPLSLKINEVDATVTATYLDDAAAVAIPSTFAFYASLSLDDALILEGADSPYANILAVKVENKDRPDLLKFLKAYQSQEVADLILKEGEGQIIPAFPYRKN
jgi:D-methionine transport system substrate-binding protein